MSPAATKSHDRSPWLARPGVGEWVAIGVIVASVAFVVAGWPRHDAGANADVQTLLRVETGPTGRPFARLDDAAFRAASLAAGLPEPPELDGGDPVPIRNILDQTHRWTKTEDPEAIGNLGRIYLALEEHRAAIECFAAAAELAPAHPHWLYLRGVEAQALGLDDLAIETFQTIGADGGDATTFARLGRLYLDRNDLDAAERSFDRCRALNPNQSLGYIGLGRVALARGDAEKAAGTLLRAVEVTPNDYRAYRFLSQAMAAIGREDDARRATAIAEQLPKYSGWLVFDDRVQAAHALANTQRDLENQMRLAQGSDARQLAGLTEQLLRRRPDDFKGWGILAGAYIKMNRLDDARAAIDKALAIEPRSVSMLCIRAQIAMLSTNFASALEVLDTAITIDPTYATSYDVRGRVLFMAERYDEAFAAMEHAIELDPSASKMRFALAVMYDRRERKADAIRVLTDLLEREPDNAAARQRLATLQDPPG